MDWQEKFLKANEIQVLVDELKDAVHIKPEGLMLNGLTLSVQALATFYRHMVRDVKDHD